MRCLELSLKKKLAVSTLAVSMAAASVAGLPLSGKGLAQQLGIVGTASALTVDQTAALKDRAAKLHAAITSTTDKAKLQAFRTEVAALSAADLKAMFLPVQGKLNLSPTQEDTLYALFKDVASLYYDPEFTEAKDIRNNQQYIDVLKAIAVKGGVSNLTVDDVYEAVFGTNGLEKQLLGLVSTRTTAQLLELATSDTVQQKLIDDAIDIVLGKTAGTDALTVSTVLKNLNITSTDVKSVFSNTRTKLTNEKDAAQVLAVAYITAFGLGNNGSTGSVGSGAVTPPTPEKAFEAASTLDGSKLLQVTDGKATVKLVDADTVKALEALAAAAKAAGKQGTALTLTVNLGTVTAASVEAPVSKAIIDAAKANGIANIAITFNGVTVTIPVTQFNAPVTLTATTLNPSTVTSITYLKLASDVYEFGLKVDGVVTTTFKQPITIKLPIKNAAGLDKELLSVAKIVNGSLQFQGGVVNGDFIVEPRDTFSSYAVVENKLTFSDIAGVQAWAGRQIQVVAAKGAIEGVGAGKFAPQSNVTRAEFAKMLIRALNLENNSATHSFNDVKAYDWFAPYVAVASEKGIITGRNASEFDPAATITRAEMATMISRALKSINPSSSTDITALSKFSDSAKISASLRDGVAFAASHNLIIGNAGKFNPNDTATRAEAAVIIYRTINFK
jgi:hypothetical protein